MPDKLDSWIAEVGRGNSRISKNLEDELFDKYMNGTPAEKTMALDKLLSYNALPIADIALDVYHRYPNGRKADILDLVHVGVAVFIRNLVNFNPDTARLITFYTRDVKTHMQRFVMHYAVSVQQGSVYLQFIAGKRVKARKLLEQQLGRVPTNTEISNFMEIPVHTLQTVDTYTMPNVAAVPGIELMNTPDGKPTHIESMVTILRTKLTSLTDKEFDELYTALYFKEDVNENLITKVLDS